MPAVLAGRLERHKAELYTPPSGTCCALNSLTSAQHARAALMYRATLAHPSSAGIPFEIMSSLASLHKRAGAMRAPLHTRSEAHNCDAPVAENGSNIPMWARSAAGMALAVLWQGLFQGVDRKSGGG